ncbi:MAG: hypothetical protein OEZ22_12070 [Spirochaetia bacterium]|nr:hypothetical protein [Spirochaetia bacterium]
MTEYFKIFRIIHFTGVIFWMTGLYSWLKLAEIIVKKEFTPPNHATIKRIFANVFTLGIYPGMLMALTGGLGMLLSKLYLFNHIWIYIKLSVITIFITISFLQKQSIFKGNLNKPLSWTAQHIIIGTGIMIILAMVIFQVF